MKYPDRSDDLIFLQTLVEKLVEKGDYETANLNLAKLIEAMRQQNVNLNNALTPILEDSKRLYAIFRQEHNLTYPSQFAQNIEGEWNSDPQIQYSELLKKATELSSSNIDESILLIKEALAIQNSDFSRTQKTCELFTKSK